MLSHRLLQKQLQLSPESAFIQTCLPKSEKFLREHKQEIIENYEWKYAISKGRSYRSSMDMILCNIFPYYKGNCKLFYLHKGPKLSDRFSKGQLEEEDRKILHFMHRITKFIPVSEEYKN